MSGLIIRNFTSATSVYYHNGLPYDVDGALLVSQGYCIGQAYTGWPRSSVNGAGDASFVTVASVTVPAGLMGPHSLLRIELDWSYSNSALVKTLAVDWGGGNIVAPTVSTSDATKNLCVIQNAGSLSSQTIQNNNNYGPAGVRTTTSVNTASAAVLDFKCKWSAAALSETITLIGYSIWHYPGS